MHAVTIKLAFGAHIVAAVRVAEWSKVPDSRCNSLLAFMCAQSKSLAYDLSLKWRNIGGIIIETLNIKAPTTSY